MIRVYQYAPCWNLPNASPFCMKLETYLRMTKLPFETKIVMNPSKAPKGKLPFIDDEGQRIADTSLIIDYLKAKYGDALDATLTPTQLAEGLLIKRTLEEHFYWCMVYSRWIDPENWSDTKKEFFAKVPWPLRSLIANKVRKDQRRVLHASGVGRHYQDEIYKMGVDDLTALHTVLGQREFILGHEPSSYDAIVYAFIANIIAVPTHSPMNTYVKSQASFNQYYERMRALYY